MSAKILEEFREEVGAATHVPGNWQRYWDDISGKELVPKLVRAAREEELTVVDEMGVWEIRLISECIQVTGKKPTKVRWVDVNKGDSESPNVRSRIVAKDFKTDARPDLFAATPPLEYLRYLVSRCASSQLGPERTKLMVQDVKKAYFYAPATRDVYIELPPERAQPAVRHPAAAAVVVAQEHHVVRVRRAVRRTASRGRSLLLPVALLLWHRVPAELTRLRGVELLDLHLLDQRRDRFRK